MTDSPATTAPDLAYGFSVVVPAFNEGLAVGDVVRRIIETMTSTGHPFEVIVVDDGSSDETAPFAGIFCIQQENGPMRLNGGGDMGWGGGGGGGGLGRPSPHGGPNCRTGNPTCRGQGGGGGGGRELDGVFKTGEVHPRDMFGVE